MLMTENQVSGMLVNLFVRVHSNLGPGLLESVYETALCYELHKRGLHFRWQPEIPVMYEGQKLSLGFRADIIVEDIVLIEIKSIEALAPVHSKIVLTYLRLSGLKLGLLVNFNVSLVRDGIVRLVNNL